MNSVINIVMAGLGGQGIVKASDILADAAFRAGFDVKKAEVHGMSQRGGSVTSDVRFGRRVLSPMVSAGEADYLVVLDESQIGPARHFLRPAGTLIRAGQLDAATLPTPKALNVGMLGMLSVFLPIAEAVWDEAIHAALPEKLRAMNDQAFQVGRTAGASQKKNPPQDG